MVQLKLWYHGRLLLLLLDDELRRAGGGDLMMSGREGLQRLQREAGRGGGGQAAREDDVHVLAGALDHLDRPLLVVHVEELARARLRRRLGGQLRVHLDERLAGRSSLFHAKQRQSR